jgi:hypothetical protein
MGKRECLTAIRHIKALKACELSERWKEEIWGELSASITHLRIQTEQMDKQFDEFLS